MTVRETSPHVSVADPEPGSGVYLTRGSGFGIDFSRILDLGSRISNRSDISEIESKIK
jgi:hypothetical protein